MILFNCSTCPAPFGNTRSSFPFGQASFHSRRALMTIGGAGTLRSPEIDFGFPISLK